MQNQFDVLLKSRKLMLKLIANLSIEQLNKIPEGFNNNIVWNIAHLVVTQQLLCYKFSDLPCLVSEDLIADFMKGTAPSKNVSANEFESIKAQLLELPKTLEQDYAKGIFKEYNSYTTSVDVTLNSVEEAINFNNLHEGIHLGVILQLRKLV